jgi:hypothetical protein
MQIRCGNQAVNANVLQVRVAATGLFKPDWMGLYFYIAGGKRCARVRGPVETAIAVNPRRFVASGKTKNPFARVAQR